MNAAAKVERERDTRGRPLIAAEPFDENNLGGRLLGYLRSNLGPSVELSELRRFTVGFSWITFGFVATWTDGGVPMRRELVLRIGPPNGIFAPYKASPEFFTLQSLAGSAVPAPGTFWFSDDSEALGAPFVIVEFVKGEAPIPWTADGGPTFDESARPKIGEQFVAALTALHNFEWRGTPAERIDGSTAVDGTADAQIDFWRQRMREWSDRRYPILELALIWFRAHAPIARRVSIVHGDFRIGNFLLLDGRLSAMLDWELVHLGDPMEDLGWICLQAWRGRSPYMCHLVSREELSEAYERRTDARPDEKALRYWEAFGTFKLAVMHLGAAHCFETRGFNDLRMAGMGAQLPRMLVQLETALERAA
jgi:aminoglycoside phosphotransferase (APT) family kinase protein